MTAPMTIYNRRAPSVANCRGCLYLVSEPTPSTSTESNPQIRSICALSGRIPGNMRECPIVAQQYSRWHSGAC